MERIRLTVSMRSCLLRASRERLAQLHQEYQGAIDKQNATVQRDVLFMEIACITSAIAWLWNQPAVDDGGT